MAGLRTESQGRDTLAILRVKVSSQGLESRARVKVLTQVLPTTLPTYDWFEERMEGQSLVDDSGTKYVPPHIGLFYCLGGIVLMGFVVQFVSGHSSSCNSSRSENMFLYWYL